VANFLRFRKKEKKTKVDLRKVLNDLLVSVSFWFTVNCRWAKIGESKSEWSEVSNTGQSLTSKVKLWTQRNVYKLAFIHAINFYDELIKQERVKRKYKFVDRNEILGKV
jgi:hypothetical protein